MAKRLRLKRKAVTADERVNIRIEPRLKEILDTRILELGARNLTDYIRGLLIADAVRNGKNLRGVLSLPGWLGSHREVTEGETIPPEMPALESSTEK